ncbi:R3H domain-containing protein 1 isoform X1 [Microplitis demolitor]|uniref:R3H domain-containing protein 1 isoform X1 n=2 Tax=Microplitis demolitor TaxID=69319 RepID=UPI0004CCC4AD|nr:R3H domain-containing protein 1 isoform X1 [Microplitis demolitor]
MARLEIPSIVVHNGNRSQSRPVSPTGPSSAEMPALPTAKNALVSGDSSYSTAGDQDMIDSNVNVTIENLSSGNTINRPTSLPVPSCQASPPDKIDSESNNFRNRTNTKVKLLVRSHAMRESTSPPREPHNGATSPRSPQQTDAVDKKFGNGGGGNGNGGLSPNNLNSKLNNNESIYNNNSNLSAAQSPKQTRNTATSPTCRTPSRNGQSSPLQTTPKSASTSPTNNRDNNNKNDNGQRSKATSPLVITSSKCNNCVKNNHNNDKPGLLQTPPSPSKSTGIQYSPKSHGQSNNYNNNNNNNNNNGHNNCQQQSRNDNNNRRTFGICNNQCSNQCSSNTLSVGSRTRHKLRHQNSSSQGSGSLDSVSPCLSRDNSTELYTDSTGIDLEQFIAVTINRNQKDRSVLLKIERELIEFAKDHHKSCHKFPNMSSYNRMLVHRVAAYFGMEHNVDQSGLSVIVTRTKNMRIPDTRFKEHIRDDLILTEEPRRSILKRDSSSFEDGYNFKSPDRLSGDYCRRSKSFEEREEEYEKVRRRIFKDSSGESSEVVSWPYWSSSESSDVSARYRLLHPGDHSSGRHARLSKGESCDGREAFRGVLRPSVSKSFSFGGYTRGMLSRGDSVTSTRSAGPRLTKQDSGASMCSRLSPSSSGYKSQSQRSDTTISPSPSPSPIPAIPCSHVQSSQNNNVSIDTQSNDTVIWAVTNISSVPLGSVIMNPRTNQPYTNSDGTIYRFDPDNLPKVFNDIEEIRESPSSETPDKFPELPESPKHNVPVNKYSSKKQKNSTKPSSPSSVCNNNGATNNRLTSTATSPTLPYSASPPPQPPPPQPVHVQDSSQSIKSPIESQPPCTHGSLNPQYQNYPQNNTELNYNPPVFTNAQPQNMIQRPPDLAINQQQQQQQQQPPPPPPPPPPPDMVFGQNNVYGNYPMMMQTSVHPQSEVTDLSGYFMGMNVYEQPRAGSEGSQTTPTFPAPPPPPPPPLPPPNGHNAPNNQAMPPGYWQPPTAQHPHQQHTHHPPNQIPPQQMYFVPPSNSTLAVSQPSNDRSTIQHQRFPSNYTYNPQNMTPSNTAPNYQVNGYPISYNSMPTVPPSPTDYSYQNPLPMMPTYYPAGQPGMQPPVMWRVPTPPSTPTSNQMPGIPVMYVNSGTYPPPPTMVTAGSYSHQLSGTNPAPPGAVYMTPSLLPNIVFRQNVPMMTSGIRASTPSGSQRTSRSPTPGHEFPNSSTNGPTVNGVSVGVGGVDNRNVQAQSRYPLPMYQGLHIVPGDIRLMHPGMGNNSRLQYAPGPSPPVLQGCPRPFRPPSYSSNNSGCPTPNSFDGRNQKIRKQRSKVTTLPSTNVRSNVYQVPSMPPSNPPKDIREGTVKVTINR